MSERTHNINSILEGLNVNNINESTADIIKYYVDKFKKLDSSIEVIDYKPSGIGSNTTTIILQDKKSKNYFVYHKGATGYATSIGLIESPDSNKSIISHYMSGINEDEEAAKFIVSTRNYKKYAKSYDTLKAELVKLNKAYNDVKALDPDGLFQNNDSKRNLFKALGVFFNDNGTKNYL